MCACLQKQQQMRSGIIVLLADVCEEDYQFGDEQSIDTTLHSRSLELQVQMHIPHTLNLFRE